MTSVGCDVCYFDLNEDERKPRVLYCGHTFCQSCLNQLILRNFKTCPKCKQYFNWESADDIPVNYLVLEFAKSNTHGIRYISSFDKWVLCQLAQLVISQELVILDLKELHYAERAITSYNKCMGTQLTWELLMYNPDVLLKTIASLQSIYLYRKIGKKYYGSTLKIKEDFAFIFNLTRTTFNPPGLLLTWNHNHYSLQKFFMKIGEDEHKSSTVFLEILNSVNALNFFKLITGLNSEFKSYSGTNFFYSKDGTLICGDYEFNDGSGGAIMIDRKHKGYIMKKPTTFCEGFNLDNTIYIIPAYPLKDHAFSQFAFVEDNLHIFRDWAFAKVVDVIPGFHQNIVMKTFSNDKGPGFAEKMSNLRILECGYYWPLNEFIAALKDQNCNNKLT